MGLRQVADLAQDGSRCVVRRKKNRAQRKDAPDKTKVIRFDSCGTEWSMIVHADDQLAYGECVHVTRNGRGCVARLRRGK
jgi:hypothetical protein